MRKMSWPFTWSWQQDFYVLGSLYFCWWKLILTAAVCQAIWSSLSRLNVLKVSTNPCFPIQYLSKIWSFLTMLLQSLRFFLQGYDVGRKKLGEPWGNWGSSRGIDLFGIFWIYPQPVPVANEGMKVYRDGCWLASWVVKPSPQKPGNKWCGYQPPSELIVKMWPVQGFWGGLRVATGETRKLVTR